METDNKQTSIDYTTKVFSPEEQAIITEFTIRFKDLDATDRKILLCYVENPIMSQTKIAARLHLTSAAISLRVNRPNFREARNSLIGTTEEILLSAQKKAAMRIEQLIEDDNPKWAIEGCKLAKDIMVAKQQSDTLQKISLPSIEEARRILANDPINIAEKGIHHGAEAKETSTKEA